MVRGVGLEPSRLAIVSPLDRFFAVLSPFFFFSWSDSQKDKDLACRMTRVLSNSTIEIDEPACFPWERDVPAEWKPTDLFGNVFHGHVLTQVVESSLRSTKSIHDLADGEFVGDPRGPEQKKKSQTGNSDDADGFLSRFCVASDYSYLMFWLMFFAELGEIFAETCLVCSGGCRCSGVSR